MKKLILMAGLVLVSFSSFAQSKIGTIDADFIVSQLPEIATVNEGLKAYNSELQAELDTSVKNFEQMLASYQAGVETFSEEEKKAKEGELISLENDIKNFRQKASVMMQMKRNELSEPLYAKINAAMLEIVNEEGFTQIFHAGGNSLAFSADSHDITEKVLKKLGITVQPQ